MLLKNFYNLCRLGAAATKQSGTNADWPIVSTAGASNGGAYSTSTAVNTIGLSESAMFASAGGVAGTYMYIAIGTGNDTVDETDYTLTDMIMSEVVSISKTAAVVGDKLALSAIVTNRGPESKTFREVGLVVANTISPVYYLVSRALLSEPLVLGSGQSATLKMMVGR